VAKTYSPITTQTLGSTAAYIDFTSIPSTYTDLVVQCSLIGSSGAGYIYMRVNSDSGANYSRQELQGDGASITAQYVSGEGLAYIHSKVLGTGYVPVRVEMLEYKNTSVYKSWVCRGADAASSTSIVAGLWKSTSAITDIRIAVTTATFAVGSTFTLYGIRAA
jgi:hypothetical protein